MTLTEEQRGTVAFDLEKARAVDIDLLAATDWGELRARYRAALAEIERLRSAIRTYREREESAFSEIEMKDEFLTRQNARINELEADLEQSERVIEARLEVIDQQAARIAELEKWLKKERSARLLEQSGSILLVYLKENEIDFDEFFDGKALEQLRAEGKIGPDAKPREGLFGKYIIRKSDGHPVDPEADYFVMRLDTDPVARRAAREYSYVTPDRNLARGLQDRLARYDPQLKDCMNIQFFGLAKPHCWQITAERIDVLGFCLSGEFNRCGCAECDRAVAVLRAMLEEAL